MTKPATYADAGVDIDAANRATEKIKELARTTFNSRTLSDIGSFGGMFDGAFPDLRQPVLVASADGVGAERAVLHEGTNESRWQRHEREFDRAASRLR